MNPITLKIVALTAGTVLVLVALVYFGFRGSSSGQDPLPSFQQTIKARDRIIDSLQALSRRQQLITDSLRARLASYQHTDSTLSQKVYFLQTDRQLLLKKYETLAVYDTLSAIDIRRYLSDSL